MGAGPGPARAGGAGRGRRAPPPRCPPAPAGAGTPRPRRWPRRPGHLAAQPGADPRGPPGDRPGRRAGAARRPGAGSTSSTRWCCNGSASPAPAWPATGAPCPACVATATSTAWPGPCSTRARCAPIRAPPTRRWPTSPRSRTLAGRLGLPVLVAMAAHNAGFALGRRGAVGDALGAFDRAEASYRELGDPPRLVAVLASDRCDVLLQVGLADDARRGRGAGRADGVGPHAAEARLLLAQACLAAGDLDRARRRGGHRRRGLRAGPPGPVGGAGRLRRHAGHDPRPGGRRDPRPGLLTGRWPPPAASRSRAGASRRLHARTFVGRVALALGRPRWPRTSWPGRPRPGPGTGGPAGPGLARHCAGPPGPRRPGGAKDALRRGLRRHRRLPGRAGRHRAAGGRRRPRRGPGPAGPAPGPGRPGRGRCCAGPSAGGPAACACPRSPPGDSHLATALADLRSARDLREATPRRLRDTRGAGPAPAWSGPVRDAARRAGVGPAGRALLDTAALAAALGDRTLVEYVNVEGTLHAVTVAAGGPACTPWRAPPVSRTRSGSWCSPCAGSSPPAGPGPRPHGRRRRPPSPPDRAAGGPARARRERAGAWCPLHPLHQVSWAALPSLAGRRSPWRPAPTVAAAAESGP